MNDYSDKIDNLIYNSFKNCNNIPDSFTNTIHNVKLKSSNNKKYLCFYFKIKKVIFYIISILAISSGVVFAKDISGFIKSLFNDSIGVETAVENNYIYSVPEEIYCESQSIISSVDELIMDDYTLDINMTLQLDENIDIEDYNNFKIPDLIIYDDLNNVIFKNQMASIDSPTQKYINSSCSIFIDYADEKYIYYTINISADEDKLPKSKIIYIDFNNIEFQNDNKKYTISGKWSNQIDVPEKFYSRTSQILKYKSCNNENIYVDSINAEVTQTCTKFNLSMNWEDYEKDSQKSDEIRQKNVNDSLLIKDNAYIETDNGKKFYASQTSDADGGYGISANGHFKYWQTFNLTKFDLENVENIKVVLETWNNEKIIIEFEK